MNGKGKESDVSASRKWWQQDAAAGSSTVKTRAERAGAVTVRDERKSKKISHRSKNKTNRKRNQ